MLKFASIFAALATSAYTELITDIGEETGEIMLWSDAPTGFNNFEEREGSLDDLTCYMKNTYYGLCDSELAKNSRTGKSQVDRPLVVAYFVDEVYSHDDLFEIKTSYGVSDYNYIEVLGIPLETGSQFYHRLNTIIRTHRYRIHANDFDGFKAGLASYSQIALMEVDTLSHALELSHKVTDYVKSHNPHNNLISVIAPSKAELDEFELMQRQLLSDSVNVTYNYSACNGSDGDYCLSYWCNRTQWDGQAYSDSCVNQYDLFGFSLIVAIFLPFCCIGCCCMDGIRTPLRYPTRVLPVRKEF